MFLDSGWGIQMADGRIEKVTNLATARWMVLHGYAVRVWDRILNTPVK